MASKFLFIDDTVACNTEKLINTFITRLTVKGFNVHLVNITDETAKFLKSINKSVSMVSEQFYLCYLNGVNCFLSNILLNKDNGNDFYLIKNIPFLYNYYQFLNPNQPHFNNLALALLHKYNDLVQDRFNYLYLYSYLDMVKGDIENKHEFQKLLLENMVLNKESSSEQVYALESIKENLNESYMVLRKNNVKCMKASFNFYEDLSNIIEKVFKQMDLN